MKGNDWKKDRRVSTLQQEYFCMRMSTVAWRRKSSYKRKMRRDVSKAQRRQNKDIIKTELSSYE